MRWATVSDVTDAGLWVTGSWLAEPYGPLRHVGATPAEGDAVLVTRTDDGEPVVIA